MLNFDKVKNVDPEVWEAICNEYQRQEDGLELIASENRPSEAVLRRYSFNNDFKFGSLTIWVPNSSNTIKEKPRICWKLLRALTTIE